MQDEQLWNYRNRVSGRIIKCPFKYGGETDIVCFIVCFVLREKEKSTENNNLEH